MSAEIGLYFEGFEIEPNRAIDNVKELLDVDSQMVWHAFFGYYFNPLFKCESVEDSERLQTEFLRAGVKLSAFEDEDAAREPYDWKCYKLSHSPFLRQTAGGGPSEAQIAWWYRQFPLESFESVAKVQEGHDFEVLVLMGDPILHEKLATFLYACCFGISEDDVMSAMDDCVENGTVLSLPRSLKSDASYDYITACFVASRIVTMSGSCVIKRVGEGMEVGVPVTPERVIAQVSGGELLTNNGHLATRLWFEYMNNW